MEHIRRMMFKKKPVQADMINKYSNKTNKYINVTRKQDWTQDILSAGQELKANKIQIETKSGENKSTIVLVKANILIITKQDWIFQPQ